MLHIWATRKYAAERKIVLQNIKNVANELQQYQTDLILLQKCCNIFLLQKSKIAACCKQTPRVIFFCCMWMKNAARGPVALGFAKFSKCRNFSCYYTKSDSTTDDRPAISKLFGRLSKQETFVVETVVSIITSDFVSHFHIIFHEILFFTTQRRMLRIIINCEGLENLRETYVIFQ